MRTTFIAVLAVAGVALAKPQTAYQISDGQVQVSPYYSSSASSAAVASSPVVVLTTPVASATAPPVYSVPVVTTPVPVIPTSSSVYVAPVNSSSVYVPVAPPASYPVPINNATTPAGYGTAPITTATPTLVTHGSPKPTASSNQVGAYGTSTTAAPAVATGAAGMIEVQFGALSVALVALAGLLA